MKFQMSAKLILSGKADVKAVENAIEDTRPLLSKGAPEGKGAAIDSYNVVGEQILITITSGRYVRPHDAIMRINKYLSGRLGKEQKVGIRAIEIDNYEIWYELEQRPLEDITLPFTEKIEITDGEAHITLKDLDQQALEDKYVDRLLRRLEEKILQQHRRPY
jgi:seryl-tRNA synthetase